MTTALQDLISRQNNRLMRLSFVNDDGPASELVIERLQGTESMSKDFRFTLELLSDDASIELEDVLGKLLAVALVRGDGTLRYFTGYVDEFSFEETDGGIATYTAVIVPWLHYLRRRQNCRLFHTQTLREQFETLTADYGSLPSVAWEVTGAQPQITMYTQWMESDHNYVHRRFEDAGWSYWYEPSEKGHVLHIGDRTLDAKPIDGASPDIRFHGLGGSKEEDAISKWRKRRRFVSGQSAQSGFDYKNPAPVQESVPSALQQGDVPRLEVHSYAGHYGFKGNSGAIALAQLCMDEIDARALQYEAESNSRWVMPGRTFNFVEHYDFGDQETKEGANAFLILEVHHDISNNYRQDKDTPSEIKNRFVCQPKDTPWYPGRGFHSMQPLILAPQTAIVVGPDGVGSLNLDADGRVQLQFHWDRERSGSCWTRVTQGAGGAEHGFINHPRVGSEVMVQFLDGNPDHPIVTGGVHNRAYMPAWKLPEQAALGGLRSRENTGDGGNRSGGRSNHVLLDDTPGHIQAQMRSDHLASQVGVGDIARVEDTSGRKELRGGGLEARTDGHLVARGGEGMLLTTQARPNAQGHITDMAETVDRLTQGEQLHDNLSQAAQQAKAHDPGDQDEVVQALTAQNADIKGSGGDPSQGQFPELQAPHLVIASAAGIETTAQGSTHIASNDHTALTSGGHTSFSVAMNLLASVRGAFRVFAYNAGMRLVSAAADIDITALKTSINLLAKLNITVTANAILISAKEKVVVNGGGSTTTWESGGITSSTSGTWAEKASSFNMSGGSSSGSPTLPQPTQLAPGKLEVFHEYLNAEGKKVDGVETGNVRVVDADGAKHGGTLDSSGFNGISQVPAGFAQVTLDQDPRDPLSSSRYVGESRWSMKGGAAADAGAGGSAVAEGGSGASATGLGGLGGSVGGLAGSAVAAASVVRTVSQALEAAQAVKKGGAKALVAPVERMAKSGASSLLGEVAAGHLPGALPHTPVAPVASASADAPVDAASLADAATDLPTDPLADA